MEQVIFVMTNVPDTATARSLARALVEQKLAACVNCLPVVQSVYRWRGAVEETAEVSLLIKTRAMRYAALEAAIRAQHPYEVPEILAIAVTDGLPAYLQWICDETMDEKNA
jgi:periplasmic divalent cation tolerance protein